MGSKTVMPRRDARLEMRISAEIKALLDEAAASVGLSTSAFVLATVTPRAREVVHQREVIEKHRENLSACRQDESAS